MKEWDGAYWTERYKTEDTPWDVGSITTPLKEYFDQLGEKSCKILIPGAGNGYEAEYLYKNGFVNVWVVDLSEKPLANLASRLPEFPRDQLVQGDFFALEDDFDLIIEQTFFCSLNPSQRDDYARKMHSLLNPGGRLVGVLFEDELFKDHPPYGGHREDYRPIFTPYFRFRTFERCYNSIKPRAGRELFINLVRK